MPPEFDPFNGTWRFIATASQLSTPTPRSWLQQITISAEALEITETMIRSDGTQTRLQIRGTLDGSHCPVAGSALFDTMTYTRPDRFTILGTGWKNGDVCLTERVTVAMDAPLLTQRYEIRFGERTVAQGVAVFEPIA